MWKVTNKGPTPDAIWRNRRPLKKKSLLPAKCRARVSSPLSRPTSTMPSASTTTASSSCRRLRLSSRNWRPRFLNSSRLVDFNQIKENVLAQWIRMYLLSFFLNGPTPTSFSFIFGLFKQTSLQFLQQINVKNVHQVYGAGIRTHNLWNMSLFP